jgi:DNA-binding response OmpR family regulator/Tfp pilus assembly protein PilZ
MPVVKNVNVREPTPREARAALVPRKCLVIGAPDDRGRDGLVLEAAGFDCVRANTLEEATAALITSRPALVLVHEQVFSRDGAHVFSAIRRHDAGREVPLVLLGSQTSSPEVLEAAWKAGVDDCILHPLLPEHLYERAGALQGSARLEPAGRGRRLARQIAVSGDAGAYGRRLCEHLEQEGLHLIRVDGYEGPPQPVDLLVYLTNSSTDVARDLSLALKRVRAASARGVLPILAVSRDRQWSNAEDARKNGIYLLDGERPPEDVVHAICGLLQRSPHRLRADQRVPFFHPVLFREPAAVTPGPWRSGFSYNLSAGGIFIKTLVPLRPAAPIEVRICLTTTREQLDVTGVVAWSNPYAPRGAFSYPIGMGIQFLGALSRGMSQLIESCQSASEL